MTHRLYLYCMLALSSIAVSSTFVIKPAAQQTAECVICLENICNNTPLSALRCTHLFHTTCIKDALEASSKCPICNIESEKQLFPRVACRPRPEQEQKGENDRERKIQGDASVQQQAGMRTPSAPPMPPRSEQELKEQEQDTVERALQLTKQEFEAQKQRDAKIKQQEDADLQAALEASLTPKAQPVAPYPTSSAQPLPVAYAKPQAAPQESQYQPYRPAASVAAAAPRSYSQQVLQAAWSKTQSWGTYFSQRARAGWSTIKGWFGWR